MVSRLESITIVLTLLLTFQTANRGQAPDSERDRTVRILPDLTDVSYGPHQRNSLDLWKAKATAAPLVIFIHGGGFRRGDKRQIPETLLEECLKRGISVAAINYRYSTDAPYPAPLRDGVRAVQFLRLHARQFGLNPYAFAATGGSAGAAMALWIGFHHDMADRRSDDPVKRQSSRLSAMAVTNGQTTMDPRAIARLITPDIARNNEAGRIFFSVEPGRDLLEARDYFAAYEDASAVTHLTKDDPPVFLHYSHADTMPPKDYSAGIHHPLFGHFLKTRMDALGIECILRLRVDYEDKPRDQHVRDWVEFFLRHFPGTGQSKTSPP